MSEALRRRKYRYDRVLIETERILDPQFDDAVVFLSGAQIEMLRNVTQYLRRLETYVTEYNPGYYLAPTVADYDDILEIVADLEETLMGNPNVIWGYKDAVFKWNDDIVTGAGDKTLLTGACPSGEVWCMDSANAWNNDTSCSKIRIYIDFPAAPMLLVEVFNPAVGKQVQWSGLLVMNATCRVYAKFYDCADGDNIELRVRGSSMDVPE